jgi:predicted peptidase
MKNFLIIFQSILLVLILGCSNKPEYDMDLINKFQPRIYKKNWFRKSWVYRLYVPENYNPKEKYPLILYLHDGGPKGNDNRAQINKTVEWLIQPSFQSKNKSFIMVPQCPKSSKWVNTRDKKLPYVNYNQDEIPESHVMKMLINEIKNLRKEFSIDKKRTYVIGYSMGGSGTWDIITRYPDFFAAAVPVAGASDPSKAQQIVHMPIWAFHGRKDHIAPVENTRAMIGALKKYGSDCKFTEYENVKHNSWHNAYADQEMITWLFSQRKP